MSPGLRAIFKARGFFFTSLYFLGFLLLGLIHDPELHFPYFATVYAILFLMYWLFTMHYAFVLSPLQILVLGIICRIALLPVLPCDDIYRYVWEGKLWLNGLNPYHLAPIDDSLIPFRDPNWHKINHPDFPAIYPPLSQLWFAFTVALGKVIPISLLMLFKINFALLEVAGFYFLRKLADRQSYDTIKQTQIQAIYFLNPLLNGLMNIAKTHPIKPPLIAS